MAKLLSLSLGRLLYILLRSPDIVTPANKVFGAIFIKAKREHDLRTIIVTAFGL